MSAGQLRQQVELQTQVSTQDALGQPSTIWQTDATVWADVRFQSGMSLLKSGADTSVSKASIRIRHRAANPGQRVLHNGIAYDVRAVQMDMRKQYIDLVCEATNVASQV